MYIGWAMEAYPNMNEAELARHVERQRKHGSSFIWIGHNNPGEVDKYKIEPGLSYAIYEAFIDKEDPRHDDACQLVSGFHRLLNVCQKLDMPVVFPVGYQLQMGERWNQVNQEHLRRNFSGKIVNWGGVSATYLSPRYQEDIIRYYSWTLEEFIRPYKDNIKLINLADEPFGGDFSFWAREKFRTIYGISMEDALKSGGDYVKKLGEFQSRYIVEYARWSAETWHNMYPEIPTTMSFCGHHGREENHMPDVVALFEDTPDHFEPTFDVYPRDGSFKDPIAESDITMLVIFLRQIAYLSHTHSKPYWLWTTGNSWGLGQNSSDKGNISDALANQFFAVSSAALNGGNLRGIAIWNYNIKHQGLYNDTNPIVYDPDDLFAKNTRFLNWLTCYVQGSDMQQPAEAALILPREFGYKKIGESKRCVWIRFYGLQHLHALAKQAKNFIVAASFDDVLNYEDSHLGELKVIIYLSDDGSELSETTIKRIATFLKQRDEIHKCPQLIIPSQIVAHLGKAVNLRITQHLIALPGTPEHVPPEFWNENLNDILDYSFLNNIYIAGMDDLRLFYNLSSCKNPLFMKNELGKWYYLIDPAGNVREKVTINNSDVQHAIHINHHGFVLTFNSLNLIEDPSTFLKKSVTV